MAKKTSEVLLEVRELVAAKHHRGSLSDGKGGFCTFGALDVACFREAGPLRADAVFFLRATGIEAGGLLTFVHDNSTHLENVVRIEKAALLAMAMGR